MKRLNKDYRRNGNNVNAFASLCACYLYTTCNCGFTGDYDPVTEHKNHMSLAEPFDSIRKASESTSR